MAVRIKSLAPDGLEKLQKLEKKWGHCIVAYESAPNYADVSSDELKEVQELETDLKSVLIDYQC